jgi:transposase
MSRLPPGAIAGELASSQSRLGHDLLHDPPRPRRSAMSQSSTLYIGVDARKDSLAVAYVAQAHDAEVTDLGALGTRQCDIDHLTRKAHSKAKHVVFVYEAGPGGSWLSRYLTETGLVCDAVAPSLIPTKRVIG